MNAEQSGTGRKLLSVQPIYVRVLLTELIYDRSSAKMDIDCRRARHAIEIANPATRCNDIVEFEKAKDVLDAEIVLPTKLPHLFGVNRQPYNPILLYGPHEMDK